MARPVTLLHPTLPSVLSRREILSAGHGRNRETRADLQRVGYGLYRRRGEGLLLPLGGDAGADGQPWHPWPLDHLEALLRLCPTAVLSHETAAILHGLPLPTGLWRRLEMLRERGEREQVLPRIHLSLPKGTRRVRREGIVDHRRKLDAVHVTELHGLRVTTLERTWLDLCALGYPWLLNDLVVGGDHLVKHPWHPDGRLPPLTTVERIRQAIVEVGQFKGKRMAKDALDLVRVGADAPSETLMRLALVDAGLPEPELQCPIDPDDAESPETDLGYSECRLAMQYEGAGHRTAEQQTRDVRRDRYAAARGWKTLKANVDDLRDGFRSFIRDVRAQRRARGC
ncbi:hypothetical protein ACL90Y_00495 [Micrococcus luteus]